MFRRPLVLLSLLALAAPALAADAPALEKDLVLKAHDGVQFKTPAWKLTRHDDEVAVLEQAANSDAKTPFYVLMLAVEAGPKDAEKVDWGQIKENITEAANTGGATLKIDVKGPYDKKEGFKGQRLAGTLTVTGRELAIEVLALVKDARLVTVSVLTMKPDPSVGSIVEAVAHSVALGPTQ